MSRPAVSLARRLHSWSTVLVLLVAVIGYVVTQPLWEPFTSERVPASCHIATPHLPTSRNRAIRGGGTGTLLVENARAAVVVSAGPGSTSGAARVYVIQRPSGRVVRTLQFASNVVDAGVDGATLYIFNNKIGYFFDAKTGDPVHYLIESDNYRGMYASSGGLFVQTDITVSAITTTGHVVWHHRFPMQSIVRGCYLP